MGMLQSGSLEDEHPTLDYVVKLVPDTTTLQLPRLQTTPPTTATILQPNRSNCLKPKAQRSREPKPTSRNVPFAHSRCPTTPTPGPTTPSLVLR